MANRYWVGGTGTWSTTTTNWAASSGGSGGETAPTSSDDVIIDESSNVGTGAFTITISGTVACASLTVSGLDGTLTMAGSTSQILQVYGNFSLNGSNITWSGAFKIQLRGTGTHTFDQGGRTFTGTVQTTEFMSGTYTLAGNFAQNSGSGGRFYISGGTFNTGNYSLTTFDFQAFGSGTKTINLGSSTVSLLGTAAGLRINPTGTTFNAGTSTISVKVAGGTIDPQGATLYNLETTAEATEVDVESSFTCNNFTITEIGANYSTQSVLFYVGATVTVNGTFTATGRDNLRRVILASVFTEEAGTWPVINAATVSLTSVDFLGLTLGGGATWSGTDIGDYGNNIGLTPTAPKTVYLVGTGAVNWNTANIFALSSGGGGSSANFPLPQDTLIIDQLTGATSLSGAGARPRAGTLNCSARTSAFTLNASTLYFIKDKLILGSGITTSGTSGAVFRDGAEIDAAGRSCATWPIYIRARNDSSPVGKVKLLANLEAAIIQPYTGYYDLNGYQSSNTILEIGTTTTNVKRGILFGGGELVLRGTGDTINGSAISNFDFPDYNDGTIRITSSAGSDLELVGTPNPSWPAFDINTTSIIDFEAGGTAAIYDLRNTTANASITFQTSRTFTFENFSLRGTSGNLATVQSSSASLTTTFSKASGIVDCDYLALTRTAATGGAAWYAGANSTNTSNTGWLFTAAVRNLTGNSVAQTATSSTGAISQTHELAGNSVAQDNASDSGSIQQVLLLTGNGVSQPNTSTTGAISQTHLLSASSTTQVNQTSTGAVSQSDALGGQNVAQLNTSTTGAVSQTHVLSGANASQANASTSAAVTISYFLTGANTAQPSTVSTGAITQVHRLLGLSLNQQNASGSGFIVIPGKLLGQNVNQINGSTSAQIAVYAVVEAPAGVGFAPKDLLYTRPGALNTTRPEQLNTSRASQKTTILRNT